LAIPSQKIPSHKVWLEQTSRNVFRPRSAQLKILDEAIKKYESERSPAALGKVKLAFEGWKKAKGPGWTMNDRNKSGALSQLNTDLLSVPAPKFDARETAALAFIAENRRNVIRNLFEGKEIVFKNANFKEGVKQAAADLKAQGEDAARWLRQAGKAPPEDTVRMGKEAMEKMVKAIFNVESLSMLGELSSLVLDIVGTCGISVAPVVGHVKDGYDLVVGWGKVVGAAVDKNKVAKRGYVIDTGAPQAAFAALKQCLDKEIKIQAAEAGIATTSFALKTGLVFVDGGSVSGPVVGAAKAAASMAMKLGQLAWEFHCTCNANELLKKGQLDIKLFEVYPLLGCYVLTSATLSDILPIKCFGQPGWMDYIEALKSRGYDGIYEAAEGLIAASPWEVRGMPKRRNRGGIVLPGLVGPAGDALGVFG
jgi:hypothetical protein